MNVILLTGRGGSKSIKGKNVHPVLGRPLVSYPMTAARGAERVDRVFVSTDCLDIQRVAREMEIEVIDRPAELACDDSELVHTLTHALDVIGGDVTYLITMHCNCAVHRPGLVDGCIDLMDTHPEADSCVTGYVDHSVHPFRTKRIDAEGFLHPWLDIPAGTSTNRQALEPCFILDGAARILRVESCFPPNGQRPFSYLGRNILHVLNESGGDVHGLDDIDAAERLLRSAGWSQA